MLHKRHRETQMAPGNTNGTGKHKWHRETQIAPHLPYVKVNPHLPYVKVNTHLPYVKVNPHLPYVTQKPPGNTKGTGKHKWHRETQMAPRNTNSTAFTLC